MQALKETHGAYYFTPEEMEKIKGCAKDILKIIKGKSLTVAEALEALEQCKALIDGSVIK